MYSPMVLKLAKPGDIEKVTSVRNLLSNIQGFRIVHIHTQKTNIGLANSVIQGITKVAKNHTAFIVIEDDILSSPHMLNFMNDSLDRYKETPKVWSINGFSLSPKILKIPKDYSYDSYFLYRNASYCWGSWSNRWRQAIWDEVTIRKELLDTHNRKRFNRGGCDLTPLMYTQLERRIDTWDVQWDYSISRKNGICLSPKYSYSTPQYSNTGTHVQSLSREQNIDLSRALPAVSYPDSVEVNTNIAKNFAMCFHDDEPDFLTSNKAVCSSGEEFSFTFSPHPKNKNGDKKTPRCSPVTVAHLVAVSGGAYNAVASLHRGLKNMGVHSSIYTADWNKHSNRWRLQKHSNEIITSYAYTQLHPATTFVSLPMQGMPFTDLEAFVQAYTVIHLHWLPGMISDENVAYLSHRCAELGKALVWTTHDMRALTGGCHYFHGCDKWKKDCAECPQFISRQWNEVPARVLSAKKKYFAFENITIVSPSAFLAKTIISKSIFKKSNVVPIPNSLDIDLFYPQDTQKARHALGLPLDKKVIIFLPSYDSSIKGVSEFRETYDYLQGKPYAYGIYISCKQSI